MLLYTPPLFKLLQLLYKAKTCKKIPTAGITYSGDLEYQYMCIIFNVAHTLQFTLNNHVQADLSYRQCEARLREGVWGTFCPPFKP